MGHHKRFFFVLILFAGATAAQAAPREVVPDASDTRKQIDALIQDAPDHRATLGLMQTAMELSISYGAPAWNAGDHDACCKFYVKTAQSLCAAFDGPKNASEPAQTILKSLHTALDRVATSTDVDANAWTMRYVFDKTEVAVAVQSGRSAAMAALGSECAARSSYQDATDAYTEASAALHELQGLPIESIKLSTRYTPFALGDALFAQRKYAEAAAAIDDGLKFIPDYAAQAGDIRKNFENPALYRVLIDDLRAAADKKPDDASLQFLYGYHLYFTGQRPQAKAYLERAKKLDSNLTGVGKLLSAPNAVKPPPMIDTPPVRPLPRNGDL